jgi:hypothetical protein
MMYVLDLATIASLVAPTLVGDYNENDTVDATCRRCGHDLDDSKTPPMLIHPIEEMSGRTEDGL